VERSERSGQLPCDYPRRGLAAGGGSSVIRNARSGDPERDAAGLDLACSDVRDIFEFLDMALAGPLLVRAGCYLDFQEVRG